LKKIVVVGLGYVGVANSILLAQNNMVIGVDVSKKKVDLLNSGIPPIEDELAADYLSKKKLSLRATTKLSEAIEGADFIILCAPTNYDEDSQSFDTSILKNIVKDILAQNQKTTIVIKSTIPVGFIDELRNDFAFENVFFSPEFLREGRALYDNLYPSRIIVGSKSAKAHEFANIMLDASEEKNAPVLLTGPREAETIKLFANTYLAMRVAFFNELDSFSVAENLDASEIIAGICSDKRIGQSYNNPSLGYGGYCLPKDTKQLRSNFKNIPQNLISAIIESNVTRKLFLISEIIKRNPKHVGIYRLTMKAGSDNFRDSAVIDFIEPLLNTGIKVTIYEPLTDLKVLKGAEIVDDFIKFRDTCDIIIANRTDQLNVIDPEKLFTRDIFSVD